MKSPLGIGFGPAVEKGVADIARVEMPAADGAEVIQAVGFHPVPVAVELTARRRLRRAMPRANKLHKEPDGERRQHAVGPHHLRPRAGLPVLTGFTLDALFGQNAEAPETRVARRGQHRLAADAEAVDDLVHVHAEIDVGDQEAPREAFELVALAVGANAAQCPCCGICRSLIIDRLPRRAPPPLPRPGEADIIVLVIVPDRPSSIVAPNHSHHLRDAACIVAVRLVDLRLQ
jgi:hypothetical protein